MKVVLSPGQKVAVTFAESDGEIVVEFAEHAITVTADMPDQAGREGVIYQEKFGGEPPERDEVLTLTAQVIPHSSFVGDGVLLVDQAGAAFCQLAVMGRRLGMTTEQSKAVATGAAASINTAGGIEVAR